MPSQTIRRTRRLAAVLAGGFLSFSSLHAAAIEFRGARDYPVPGTPEAIISADLTNSGQTDLVVANFGGIAVYKATQTGAFAPAYSLFGTATISVVAGDFNNDGKLDLAAVQLTNGSQVVFLPGNGDGTFGTPTVFQVGIGPWKLAAADFNGDGNLDLVTPGSVLLGNGDGTFQAPVLLHAGDVPGLVATGDFNTDGRPDIALGSLDNLDITVLLNQGGRLAPTPSFPVSGLAVNVATGDFNGDGLDDLAVVSSNSGTVGVLLSNGHRTFSPSAELSVPGAATVLVRDFNRDGHLDLAVGTSTQVFLFFGAGNGTFTAGPVYDLSTYCTIFDISPGPMPCFVAGDFNGDGILDLAGANGPAGTISVLLGNGDGTFRTGTTFSSGPNPLRLVAANFGGVGGQDLAVANYIDGVSIFLNQGNGTFGSPIHISVGTNPVSLAAADLNGDGITDLVVGDCTSPVVWILLGSDGGAFGAPTPVSVDSCPVSLAVADFNLDGIPDIAAANIMANSASVLQGAGGGTFHAETLYDVAGQPAAIVAARVLSAQQPDLVVVGEVGRVSILTNVTR